MTTIECPITCRFVTFCSPAILKISFKAIISAKLFEPVPRHALGFMKCVSERYRMPSVLHRDGEIWLAPLKYSKEADLSTLFHQDSEIYLHFSMFCAT